MATMSIRGLDDKALARLKQRAEREGSSVNSLVVQILQDDGGAKAKVPSLRRHRDLDALAGTWTERDANAFERATAPFSKVDPTLWK
jgi:plasmid stability protein